ncbi:MAG: hypothetical protein K6B44_04970 [Lachnospiraceae bacterium]|nr:hypothetical protein [Lachnospiraceae bacterium]
MKIRIIDVFDLKENGMKVAIFTGDDLKCGMMVKKVSTPYGIIEATGMDIVKEACFSPGHYHGVFVYDKTIPLKPCEADILEYKFYDGCKGL